MTVLLNISVFLRKEGGLLGADTSVVYTFYEIPSLLDVWVDFQSQDDLRKSVFSFSVMLALVGHSSRAVGCSKSVVLNNVILTHCGLFAGRGPGLVSTGTDNKANGRCR